MIVTLLGIFFFFFFTNYVMTFDTVRGSDLTDSHIICRDSLTLNAGYLLNLARVVASLTFEITSFFFNFETLRTHIG